MVCVAEKSNTRDPYIIYDFFFYGERGFPTDPVKWKVIFNSWLYFI